ncbi:gsr0358 [Gloeobacter violaceus PCC 7421]|uniref:Gsr0358 protein n=1 Tax=Gloeobacter violaceus (strain ATCC 29082 / PCC 7421) TaxID=251221 RepID=Q7NNQ2_GLOVI|nr:gsr0358 [Gloeobacter violaceus PCC 7421]
MVERIGGLADGQIDALAEVLLDFGSAADLQHWLDSRVPS